VLPRGAAMTFEDILDQAINMLQRRGRLTYRTLQRQFQLDNAALEDLKDELIYGQRLAVDEEGRVLVWSGVTGSSATAPVSPPSMRPPLAYTPPYLAEKILTSRSALEGERKLVTVLFADLKGSMELLAERAPEDARQLLDPVLERMMAAVHRYEGTVNQVMGDGIMPCSVRRSPMKTTRCGPATRLCACRRRCGSTPPRCSARRAYRSTSALG
jgi:hypothetical protein